MLLREQPARFHRPRVSRHVCSILDLPLIEVPIADLGPEAHAAEYDGQRQGHDHRRGPTVVREKALQSPFHHLTHHSFDIPKCYNYIANNMQAIIGAT